ncbi:hypothetical protein [Marinobacter sp. CA1]|uniref:hypothetical protein n=1 Tax=Marinobacter sp. CA1 TaxID=2817656 RepID=UPI001D06826C|nr:hypothetical protein [Marinobacter sp. CA1]UDL03352.1 hypothetical protein J2887_11295 [Marinobacter sp. CA1]
MESSLETATLGLLALLNYSFAFMVSIEVCARDLMPRRHKIGWSALAWLIPIIGPIFTHRYLNIGWVKGSGRGGSNGIVPPSDGGGSGGF